MTTKVICMYDGNFHMVVERGCIKVTFDRPKDKSETSVSHYASTDSVHVSVTRYSMFGEFVVRTITNSDTWQAVFMDETKAYTYAFEQVVKHG